MRNTTCSFKRTLLLFFILTLGLAPTLTGQIGKKYIKGTVQDSVANKPLPLVTVGLYRRSNLGKPIKMTFTDSTGKYMFQTTDSGYFVVIASHTAYREKQSAIRLSSGEAGVTLEPILLTPSSEKLKKVLVNSAYHAPLIEEEGDKLIFHVDEDASLEGQSAIDALRKTPFITVTNNNGIMLRGQSNFLILLNGRPSGMLSRNPGDILHGLPAGLIKRIEVITNPGAKYDAEGVGGVINIVTRPKAIGSNGSVSASANTLGGYSGSGNLNLKHGRVGFTGYYAAGHSELHPVKNYSETESLDPDSYSKRVLDGNSRTKTFWNNGNGELSWDVDSLTTLSGYANLSGGNNENNSTLTQTILLADKTSSLVGAANNYNKNSYPALDWGVDYIRKFKKRKDQEFSARFNRSFVHDNSFISGEQSFPTVDRFISNNNVAHDWQYTLQADYAGPIGSGRFEAGVKTILRHAVADYQGYSKYASDAAFALDPANSDTYDYHQDVYSAYLSYAFKIRKVQVKLGSRLENTVIDSWFETDHTPVKQNYTNLFPSVSFSKRIRDKFNLSLSYSRRVKRPYIWSLNPFVDNTDTMNISYGNPHLKPQLMDNIELGFGLFNRKWSIALRLAESFSNSLITRYSAFHDTTGVLAWTTGNVGRYSSTGLFGSIYCRVSRKLSANANLGLQYDVLGNSADPGQGNKGLAGSVYGGFSYDLNARYNFFGNASWWASPVQPQGQQHNDPWYNAGGSARVLKNKVRITLTVANFFREGVSTTKRYSDYNFRYYSSLVTPIRAVSMSIRYTFGKLRENVSRKKGVVNDDIIGKN